MAQLFLMDKNVGTNPVNRAGVAQIYVASDEFAQPGKYLQAFLDKVAKETPNGIINSMSIFAHAAGAVVQDEKKLQSVNSVAGFCLGEVVGDINVHEFSRLKMLFAKPRSHICNLLSCCQATNGPDYQSPEGWGTSGKNMELCKALASHLDQFVRTADAPQVFNTQQGPLDRLMGEKSVDFGTWEGNVYLFSPDGSYKKDTPSGRF